MNRSERIIIDPAILTGKPVIRGTRVAVEFIIELLAQDWTEEDIRRNYPNITHEDILACLQCAAMILKAERVFPLPPAGAARLDFPRKSVNPQGLAQGSARNEPDSA